MMILCVFLWTVLLGWIINLWSIIDAYLAWVWFRIAGAGFEVAAFPALADHHHRADARPSAQRALAREAAAQDELERAGLSVPLS